MAISLSSIKKSTMQPPRIVIYGPAGVGKTSFAAEAPKPVFLRVENGMGMIEADGWDIQTYQDVLDAITVLYRDQHEFQTVVLDTIDAFEPLMWSEVCARILTKDGKRVGSIEEYGWGDGHKHSIPFILQILNGLTALGEHRGMASIVCAHSKVHTVKSPDSDDYEKFTLKINEKSEGVVRGWCDAMLFANYETTVISNGPNDKRHRAIGSGRRLLYTTERPAFYAKNRYSLPPILPFDKGQAWNAFVAAQAASYAASRQVPTPQPELASTPATPAAAQ